jgi:hypothetical protein
MIWLLSYHVRWSSKYTTNLTCWKISKNKFGLSASKLSKNLWFFWKDKIKLGSVILTIWNLLHKPTVCIHSQYVSTDIHLKIKINSVEIYWSWSTSTSLQWSLLNRNWIENQKWNWKKDARHPTEWWKINMAFCVGIRTHVIRGTIIRIPECLSHYAIEAMSLEKLYYIFKYFQMWKTKIHSLWCFISYFCYFLKFY